ncbi:macrophage mannose receptor 1 [Etheostoma spectabile]|uniref:macrophage mannose receptor 1 n=1 Tax=Etheostoma spectabile TaxID=54343 RepID=UPI0013AFA614|nr:macrophage mannose receptor 1-like [Etheostoma spectabile]
MLVYLSAPSLQFLLCYQVSGPPLGVSYVTTASKTWKEAQKYCRKNHTDLATVSNQEDMKRLQHHVPAGAWIGLQRDWRWSRPGVEFNDSKWSPGQPDNYNSNKEDCVWMTKDGWHDDSCASVYKFICYDERKTSGNTFYVSTDEMTWREAQNYCRTNHTDLISGVQQLEDFKTNPLYMSLYTQEPDEKLWIGLFRDPDWSWSDGSNFSFTNWDEQNPDPDRDPKKSCAMTTSGGAWSSDDCNETKTFFCYDDSLFLIKENRTWEDALYYCRDLYGDLVSIANLDQQLWVQERAKMATTYYVWLGLRYTCTLDVWFWVSDETSNYTNWDPSKTTGDDCNMSAAMDRRGGAQVGQKDQRRKPVQFHLFQELTTTM